MSTFDDTSTPITTRARDMRLEAYTESAIEALELVIVHNIEAGPESVDLDAQIRKAQAYVIDLTTGLQDYLQNEDDPSSDALEYLGELVNEAEDLASYLAPEGWYFGSDENDPSYGGFYREEDEEGDE